MSGRGRYAMSRYAAPSSVGARYNIVGQRYNIVGADPTTGAPVSVPMVVTPSGPVQAAPAQPMGPPQWQPPVQQFQQWQPPTQQYWDPGYAPQEPAPYSVPPRNMLVERRPPDRADRILLPMSSGVNILPNTSAQITSRPQNVAFRPERIIIGGTPGDWIVNDIKVGNRSQFSQSGDVPGETFASTAIDSFVSFETVQTAMDFVMLVTFVGVSESGAPFVCSVLGTAAI